MPFRVNFLGAVLFASLSFATHADQIRIFNTPGGLNGATPQEWDAGATYPVTSDNPAVTQFLNSIQPDQAYLCDADFTLDGRSPNGRGYTIHKLRQCVLVSPAPAAQ